MIAASTAPEVGLDAPPRSATVKRREVTAAGLPVETSAISVTKKRLRPTNNTSFTRVKIFSSATVTTILPAELKSPVWRACRRASSQY